ncbi:helicase-associated domain-containing protein [Actinomyces naeslundii]|uniref:Helicase-associated domain-containing protein n=1 Tax=Actinomyces naeslundii TaxID=1655 RepID=A0AA47FG94_ACTNA|nr:helicase-associated domain-containing protein [Actinomyces naeslundii]WAL41984.1 helicase-associated domain-containing protein [Actinomyces naeslundii]
MSPSASTQDLAVHLTALPDREVAALLVARPDLAAPPSSSFLALATRAGAQGSIEHALAGLDAPTLAVAEAVVALSGPTESEETEGVGGTQTAEGDGSDGTVQSKGEPANPVGADLAGLVAAHLPLPVEQVADALGHLSRLALVVEDRPVAALEAAFGPHPFGLGPWAAEPLSAEQLPPTLEELSEDAAGEPVVPAASVEMLQALTWGPPAGTLRSGGRAPGAAPLIERGWLERSSDARGRTRFILPRQVALALRGGRLTRETLTAPEAGDLETVGADVVASESSFHAEETVRLVAALLEEWGREGGTIRRTGGVSVRALTRTADALDLELHEAARIIEIAAGAGLLGLDDDGATWVPSTLAAGWLADSLPQRWAPLALAWAGSARTSWLTGTRDDDGTLRAALGPDLEAGWAVRLRARVLALLGDLSQGTSATPAFVRAALTWESPRRTIPGGAISAVLAEAETLGITGGGALTEAGRILARRAAVSLDERDVVRSDSGGDAGGAEVTDGDAHAEPLSDDETLAALEAALAADLPAAVDMILVQSDLTAIVPGRPAPELAALLERTSVVESRGGALTVRFTPESVRGALDVGYRAEEITQAIGRYSPAPLPDSLSVLIQDAARHHGAVRVRAVSALLRVGDEATAAGLLAEPRLKDLGLDEVAPGILVATASAGQVLRELRATGLAPVTEDASGQLVVGPATAQQAHRAPEPTHPGSEHSVRRRRPGSRELATLVGRLRVGQEALQAAGEAAVATDPVHALAVLRQAQSSRSRLRLTLAGPDGAVQERQVRVMAVEPGRVRLRDVVRETELTVAVHRIVSVEAN